MQQTVEYCTVHPLQPATWHCPDCGFDLCDEAVSDPRGNDRVKCLNCDARVESLGARNTAQPFWRRLPDIFRYGLQGNALMVALLLGLGKTLGLFLPFALLFNLLALGLLFNYAQDCLEKTAHGDFKAPTIQATLENSLVTALAVVGLTLLTGLLLAGVANKLGQGVASLFAVALTVALPAMLINYALTQRLSDALNLARAFWLIRAIGAPYGLLLAAMAVMFFSVLTLQQWLQWLPFAADLAQNTLSMVYLIVLFHLMGYLVFQYQGELGYAAREVSRTDPLQRTELDEWQARLELLARTAQFARLEEALHEAIHACPGHWPFQQRLYHLYQASGRLPQQGQFLRFYANTLHHSGQQRALHVLCKNNMKQLLDEELTAELNLHLANACQQFKDHRAVIRLLNGFQRRHRGHASVPAALQMLAAALDELPEMAAQADKCRALLARHPTGGAT